MQKLVVLAGPTAVGKTALSIAAAKHLEAEIISGDSMQVYRGMDIGTAKIRPEEMAGVPHHLIDVLLPHEPFHAAGFKTMAEKNIQEIAARNHLPLLVGGTGLYISGLVYNYDFSGSGADRAVRQRLESLWDAGEAAHLYEDLQNIDPVMATRLPAGDRTRIVRALEIYYSTGKLPSEAGSDTRFQPVYDLAYVCLTMERSALYARIDARVEQMFEEGLVEEVRRLLDAQMPQQATAMQAIGYKEVVQHLQGALSLDDTIALIQRNTRRYAKRQLTWFRRDPNVHLLDVTDHSFEDILESFLQHINSVLHKDTDAI